MESNPLKLIFFIKIAFVSVSTKEQAFRPRRSPAHLLTNGIKGNPAVALNDNFIVDVGNDVAVAQSLNGKHQNVPCNCLHHILREFRTVAFRRPASLLRLLHRSPPRRQTGSLPCMVSHRQAVCRTVGQKRNHSDSEIQCRGFPFCFSLRRSLRHGRYPTTAVIINWHFSCRYKRLKFLLRKTHLRHPLLSGTIEPRGGGEFSDFPFDGGVRSRRASTGTQTSDWHCCNDVFCSSNTRRRHVLPQATQELLLQ